MTSQLHDFNPGISSNGLFWILQIPDDAVKITDGTLTISLTKANVVDQFQFPGGAGNNLGTAGVPATVSFDITYTKLGMPRNVRPTSFDPLSPFAWSGQMWTATNSGSFSLAYNDGSFSATGSFSSSGNFGEMGTERNGSFAAQQMEGEGATLPLFKQNQTSRTEVPWNASAAQTEGSPKFKGRIPLKSLLH